MSLFSLWVYIYTNNLPPPCISVSRNCTHGLPTPLDAPMISSLCKQQLLKILLQSSNNTNLYHKEHKECLIQTGYLENMTAAQEQMRKWQSV